MHAQQGILEQEKEQHSEPVPERPASHKGGVQSSTDVSTGAWRLRVDPLPKKAAISGKVSKRVPKPKKGLPNSVYFDYQFDGNENEFPYEEEDLKDLYNVDQIIASLEKQSNTPSKGFG